MSMQGVAQGKEWSMRFPCHPFWGRYLFLVFLCFLPTAAWGYRPFVSTDAAVAEPQRVEVELGYFTLERDHAENTFIVPQLVLNYGLVSDLELVGEFQLAWSPEHETELIEPALSLKAVLKEGVLQEKPGASVAMELSLLLPATVPGEGTCGFEGVVILSAKLSPFVFHINVGGGVERGETAPFVLWGVIAELPLHPTLRLVGEINGESVRGEAADTSGLLGVIWEPPWPHAAFDVGVRRGISEGAADWRVTAGVTFSFAGPFATRK
jgi:hypothetical protein